jgi:hypothetical protein
MKYIPPFDAVKACVTIHTTRGELAITCRYDGFVDMIRKFLIGIEFNEAWYLQHYPDIAEAIGQGLIASAREHFINDGYFEGRLPFPIRVDEAWYLQQNEGVADYVERGLLESGQQHFDENGYREGRLPFGL